MSDTFAFEHRRAGELLTITLSGEITERTDLAPVFAETAPRIEIDLGGIVRINSGGCREWVLALKSIADDVRLTFVRCSVPIVEQVNMIANFLRGGTVASFLAPYYSASENREYTLLIDVAKHFGSGKPLVAPDFSGAPNVPDDLEFDDDEEEFFFFLESQLGRKGDSGRHPEAMA